MSQILNFVLMEPRLEVTCAIIEHDGKVLCARRSAEMTHPGKWEFPGGKVEAGEGPETCLVREIREELGVLIGALSPLSPVDHRYPGGRPLRLIPFRCRILEGSPVALQHEEIAWMDRSELARLDWVEADIRIVEEYLRISGSRV